jgi:hypothetical protein
VSFDRVMFGLHNRAAFRAHASRFPMGMPMVPSMRVAGVATVGGASPPGVVPPPAPAAAAIPPPAPGSRSRWPLVVAAAAVAGAVVYIAREQEHARMHELENELDNAEHHCACPSTPLPENAPAWVRDEALWERAKFAVRPNWDRYDKPWAVVARVYENMGGRTA